MTTTRPEKVTVQFTREELRALQGLLSGTDFSDINPGLHSAASKIDAGAKGKGTSTTTQRGHTRCLRYRWPDESDGRVYETLTEDEFGALTADELRAAINGSATAMRDVKNGRIWVFDSAAMEAAH